MGNQPIKKNEAPAELQPSVLAGDTTFEVESPVDPGGYVQEVSFVVRSDKPMTNHEINNH